MVFCDEKRNPALMSHTFQGANSVYSTDSDEESERERVRKGSLGRLAERRFQSMLRALTGRRGEMARCMAFSLEHADAVSEVGFAFVVRLSPARLTIRLL